jgi:hypothetical protein
MVTGEIPASAILLHGQSMAGSEMPLEHLAAPAAFEAHDIIAVNRSPYRDGGCPLTLDVGCRFSESTECLMNGRDQRPELGGRDLVLPNIGGDNRGSEFSIKC